jgi:hypothetical protein
LVQKKGCAKEGAHYRRRRPKKERKRGKDNTYFSKWKWNKFSSSYLFKKEGVAASAVEIRNGGGGKYTKKRIRKNSFFL